MSLIALCTTLSSAEGSPNGLSLPLRLGIKTRRTRLSRAQSTTAVPPQQCRSIPARSIPKGAGHCWFPGSTKRLCPLALGGTTAYVATATLISILDVVVEPHQHSQERGQLRQ